MTSTFTAFIDESGDEGYDIVPWPERKSSEWFIISAAVCANSAIRSLEHTAPLGKKFHFRRADHHASVAMCQRIAQSSVTVISIIAHKPSMPEESAVRTRPHFLFDYCTKLLIERVSWFCDDNKGRDLGTVSFIFSKRRQLKIERIREYLGRLRGMSSLYRDAPLPVKLSRNSIRWGVIDLTLMEMQPHDSMPGLQIADAVVSGTARALEYSPSQTTEHRFIKAMRSRFYRYRGRAISYGIKFIPDEIPDEDPFMPDRFHWLRHFK